MVWVGGILLWAMGHGGARCVVVVIKKTANDKNIGCGDGKGHVALANMGHGGAGCGKIINKRFHGNIDCGVCKKHSASAKDMAELVMKWM